jgi:hypothetical protein
MGEATTPAIADYYSTAIDRALEKLRLEAANCEARFTSFRARPPEAERVTEAEWLASTDPERMLREVGPAASTRMLRLFMCACCRRVWEDIDPYYRAAVEATEKYLEGEATDGEFWSAASDVGIAWSLHRASYECSDAEEAAACLTFPDPLEGAISCVQSALASCRPTRVSEAAAQASLLRCIFGNPFRPAGVLSGWRTDAVLGLSRAAYGSRDFALMPILADALQDAGCGDEQLLGHCRSSGTHVRGCWVLDLVLGKG